MREKPMLQRNDENTPSGLPLPQLRAAWEPFVHVVQEKMSGPEDIHVSMLEVPLLILFQWQEIQPQGDVWWVFLIVDLTNKYPTSATHLCKFCGKFLNCRIVIFLRRREYVYFLRVCVSPVFGLSTYVTWFASRHESSLGSALLCACMSF
jgi:hypothetical protein